MADLSPHPGFLTAMLEAYEGELIEWLEARGIIGSDKQTVVVLPRNGRGGGELREIKIRWLFLLPTTTITTAAAGVVGSVLILPRYTCTKEICRRVLTASGKFCLGFRRN